MTVYSFNKGTTNKEHRGLINDSISDMLTRIRNSTLAKKSIVNIPFTNLNQEIAHLLEKEGFIQSYQYSLESNDILIRLKYRSKKVYLSSVGSDKALEGKTKESCITNLRRISKPGLRIYANYREIPRILGGTGIVIVSTSKGIMTDREARAQRLGGELLCSVW